MNDPGSSGNNATGFPLQQPQHMQQAQPNAVMYASDRAVPMNETPSTAFTPQRAVSSHDMLSTSTGGTFTQMTPPPGLMQQGTPQTPMHNLNGQPQFAAASLPRSDDAPMSSAMARAMDERMQVQQTSSGNNTNLAVHPGRRRPKIKEDIVPTLKRPSATDGATAIINYLMSFNLNKEEDFTRKALESLHKKLKDRPRDIDTLLNAVQSHGTNVGECITVQRTLDGRLQVAGRKGFPHVIYAKIFRWPDLHKNELKHNSQCKFAFDMKNEMVGVSEEDDKKGCISLVCINPFHYDRITAPPVTELTGQLELGVRRGTTPMQQHHGMPMQHMQPMHTQHQTMPSHLQQMPQQQVRQLPHHLQQQQMAQQQQQHLQQAQLQQQRQLPPHSMQKAPVPQQMQHQRPHDAPSTSTLFGTPGHISTAAGGQFATQQPQFPRPFMTTPAVQPTMTQAQQFQLQALQREHQLQMMLQQQQLQQQVAAAQTAQATAMRHIQFADPSTFAIDSLVRPNGGISQPQHSFRSTVQPQHTVIHQQSTPERTSTAPGQQLQLTPQSRPSVIEQHTPEASSSSVFGSFTNETMQPFRVGGERVAAAAVVAGGRTEPGQQMQSVVQQAVSDQSEPRSQASTSDFKGFGQPVPSSSSQSQEQSTGGLVHPKPSYQSPPDGQFLPSRKYGPQRLTPEEALLKQRQELVAQNLAESLAADFQITKRKPTGLAGRYIHLRSRTPTPEQVSKNDPRHLQVGDSAKRQIQMTNPIYLQQFYVEHTSSWDEDEDEDDPMSAIEVQKHDKRDMPCSSRTRHESTDEELEPRSQKQRTRKKRREPTVRFASAEPELDSWTAEDMMLNMSRPPIASLGETPNERPGGEVGRAFFGNQQAAAARSRVDRRRETLEDEHYYIEIVEEPVPKGTADEAASSTEDDIAEELEIGLANKDEKIKVQVVGKGKEKLRNGQYVLMGEPPKGRIRLLPDPPGRSPIPTKLILRRSKGPLDQHPDIKNIPVVRFNEDSDSDVEKNRRKATSWREYMPEQCKDVNLRKTSLTAEQRKQLELDAMMQDPNINLMDKRTIMKAAVQDYHDRFTCTNRAEGHDEKDIYTYGINRILREKGLPMIDFSRQRKEKKQPQGPVIVEMLSGEKWLFKKRRSKAEMRKIYIDKLLDMQAMQKPLKLSECVCANPEDKPQSKCGNGKHTHYPPSASGAMINAAFFLRRCCLLDERGHRTGKLYEWIRRFNCPDYNKQFISPKIEDIPPTAPQDDNCFAWASILYHEYNWTQSEHRQAISHDYIIDGGLDPTSNDRLCMGAIQNPGRTEEVEIIRRLIGGGIKISLKGNGDVWVTCISRFPIYIQSYYLDCLAGRCDQDAIHKLYPNASIKIFDHELTITSIYQAFQYQRSAYEFYAGMFKDTKKLPAPLPFLSKKEIRNVSKISPDEVQKLTIVNVSFIKGWGPEFRRKTILESPVWISIFMNRANSFIDKATKWNGPEYTHSDMSEPEQEVASERATRSSED